MHVTGLQKSCDGYQDIKISRYQDIKISRYQDERLNLFDQHINHMSLV